MNLVDELMTSDDYLLNAAENANIYAVSYEEQRNMLEKLGINVRAAIELRTLAT